MFRSFVVAGVAVFAASGVSAFADEPAVALAEAPRFPLGMPVSEFTASTSAVEVSVAERGRRRFDLNSSSLWEGAQSVTVDFIDNKLAMLVITSNADQGWTAFIGPAIARRGPPRNWNDLAGTSLFERRIVEDSAAWSDSSSVVAYMREASSSGSRHMLVLMSLSRFETMKKENLIEGAARQLISLNLLSLITSNIDVTYVRAFHPMFTGLLGVDFSWNATGATPFLGVGAGLQWYPWSGGSPKGFFLEASGRVAISSEGAYAAWYGKAGYNFIFASGFALGLSAGASYAADRTAALFPSLSLSVGFAP